MQEEDCDDDFRGLLSSIYSESKTNDIIAKSKRRERFQPGPIKLRPWEVILRVIAAVPAPPREPYDSRVVMESYRAEAVRLLDAPNHGRAWEKRAMAVCQEYVMTTEIMRRQSAKGIETPEY